MVEKEPRKEPDDEMDVEELLGQSELGEPVEEGKELAIKDIYAGAYLHAIGYEVVRAESDGYQAEFFFANVPSSALLAYYNDSPESALPARKLFDSFQTLRRISRQVRVLGPKKGGL